MMLVKAADNSSKKSASAKGSRKTKTKKARLNRLTMVELNMMRNASIIICELAYNSILAIFRLRSIKRSTQAMGVSWSIPVTKMDAEIAKQESINGSRKRWS